MQSVGKPQYPIWVALVFALFSMTFLGHRAFVESDIASRQQVTTGTTAQCEERGRGHANWCHYIFSVDNIFYSSVSEAPPEVTAFQTVDVYYDRQNPKTNALIDFSEQRRKDMEFIGFIFFPFVLCVGFILWNRAPSKVPPHELAP